MKLDGFLVPRADAHQNEYVAPCEERLAWLDRLHRQRRLRHRAAPTRPRCSSMAAIRSRRANRSTPKPSRSSRWPRSRPPTGWRKTPERARASATIRGFIPPDRSRGSRRRRKRPAPASSPWTKIRSTPSGATAPPSRRARVALHPPRHAGESAVKKLARVAASAQGRRVAGQRPPRLGLGLQPARRRRRPYADRARLCAHSAQGQAAPVPRAGKADRPEQGRARATGAAVAALRPARRAEDLGAKKQKLLFDAGTAPSRLTSLFTRSRRRSPDRNRSRSA